MILLLTLVEVVPTMFVVGAASLKLTFNDSSETTAVKQ